MYGQATDPQTVMVQQLHDLALSLNAAKQANNVAAVKGLWEQFRAVAQRYAAVGSSERAVLDFVNRVQDGTLTFLSKAGEVGVQGVKLLSSTVLVPLALIAGVIYFGPALLQRGKRA